MTRRELPRARAPETSFNAEAAVARLKRRHDERATALGDKWLEVKAWHDRRARPETLEQLERREGPR